MLTDFITAPMPWLSIVCVIAPLVAAFGTLLFPKENENGVKWWAITTSSIIFLGTLFLWLGPYYDSGSPAYQLGEEYFWIPILDVYYRVAVDGLSLPLVVLTSLLTLVSIYYSARVIHYRVKEYFFLFLLLSVGMYGVFIALDLFLFYVFWEIGLVPMYFLIGIWGGARREYAAIKFFLYTLTGSVLMLLAFLGIYWSTGSFDITALPAAELFGGNFLLQALAFWGIFLSFAIKLPLFPFHTWLPDAHVEAPTAGSVILAGILLKLGGYGMLRILLPIFPEAFNFFWLPIAILAVISIVYGALVAMAQWDLKKLIAYTSVNHMGYAMLGIAAAAAVLDTDENMLVTRAIALNGAMFQFIAHGLITGALFLLVGVIYERAHTRDLREFGGLGGRMPVYYGFLALTTFASLGLPGLAGFVAEFMAFRGAFGVGLEAQPALAVITAFGLLGIVFTAALFLWKVIQGLFLGQLNPKWAELPDMQGWEVVALAPLAILFIWFGLYPAPILNMINLGVVKVLGLMR